MDWPLANSVNSCTVCHLCAVSALTDALYIENEKNAVGQRDVRHNWCLVFLLMDSGWDWNEKTSHSQSLNQKYSPVVDGAKLVLTLGSKHSHFPLSQTVHFSWQPFKCLCVFKRVYFWKHGHWGVKLTWMSCLYLVPINCIKGFINCAIVTD